MKKNNSLNFLVNKKLKNIFQLTKQRLSQLLSYQNYQKFIIVSHARCGSNLLLSGLDLCPNLHISSEIFAGHNRTIGENFDFILKQLFSKKPRNIRAVGCKIFYYHLTEEEWKKLALTSNLKIIHLKRRDVLRIITSLEIAFKTDSWKLSKESKMIEVKDKKVNLNYDKALQKFKDLELWDTQLKKRFKDSAIQEIYYEDLSADFEQSIVSLLDFLGLKNKPTEFPIKLKKQNPEPLCELIENYCELKEQFQKTRWYSFFQ